MRRREWGDSDDTVLRHVTAIINSDVMEMDNFPACLSCEEISIIGFKLEKLFLAVDGYNREEESNKKIDGCDILLLSIAYSRRISGEMLLFKVCVFCQLFLVCSDG